VIYDSGLLSYKVYQWHGCYTRCTLRIRDLLIMCYIPSGPKKTVPQFYFCDNFRKCTPIFTIFSLLEQEIHAA